MWCGGGGGCFGCTVVSIIVVGGGVTADAVVGGIYDNVPHRCRSTRIVTIWKVLRQGCL